MSAIDLQYIATIILQYKNLMSQVMMRSPHTLLDITSQQQQCQHYNND